MEDRIDQLIDCYFSNGFYRVSDDLVYCYNYQSFNSDFWYISRFDRSGFSWVCTDYSFSDVDEFYNFLVGVVLVGRIRMENRDKLIDVIIYG